MKIHEMLGKSIMRWIHGKSRRSFHSPILPLLEGFKAVIWDGTCSQQPACFCPRLRTLRNRRKHRPITSSAVNMVPDPYPLKILDEGLRELLQRCSSNSPLFPSWDFKRLTKFVTCPSDFWCFCKAGAGKTWGWVKTIRWRCQNDPK